MAPELPPAQLVSAHGAAHRIQQLRWNLVRTLQGQREGRTLLLKKDRAESRRPSQRRDYSHNPIGNRTMTTLTCPECGSEDVTLSHIQMFMANSGDHYCHSVKTQDFDSPSSCLDCDWVGIRDQLKGKTDV